MVARTFNTTCDLPIYQYELAAFILVYRYTAQIRKLEEGMPEGKAHSHAHARLARSLQWVQASHEQAKES